MAYPVEPFRLEDVQGELAPPWLASNRDRMGKQPRLPEKADRCLENALQYMHPGATSSSPLA